MTSLILPNTIANGVNADGDKLDQNLDVIVSWSNTEVINRDGSIAMTAPLLLPGDPTQANQAATKHYVDTKAAGGGSSGGDPIGAMVTWHVSIAAPTGWLNCQGQAVSRTTYAALYAVIGTKYGIGNGSTTFAVPNAQVYVSGSATGYAPMIIRAL
jgi:hypothetical protein